MHLYDKNTDVIYIQIGVWLSKSFWRLWFNSHISFSLQGVNKTKWSPSLTNLPLLPIFLAMSWNLTVSLYSHRTLKNLPLTCSFKNLKLTRKNGIDYRGDFFVNTLWHRLVWAIKHNFALRVINFAKENSIIQSNWNF